MVKKGIYFLLLGLIGWSTPSFAAKFCYLWVAKDGSITSYQGPPIDVNNPPNQPLAGSEGRLLIALTDGPCREGRVIQEATVLPAEVPSLPSAPAP